MADTERMQIPAGMKVLDLSDHSTDARGHKVTRLRYVSGELEMTPEMRAKMLLHGYALETAGNRRGRPPKATRVAPDASGAVA